MFKLLRWMTEAKKEDDKYYKTIFEIKRTYINFK